MMFFFFFFACGEIQDVQIGMIFNKYLNEANVSISESSYYYY